MKFSFFQINKAIPTTNNYLALFLKEEEGIVLILSQKKGGMVIREKERFHYSDGWEHLIEDIDEILYRLEQKFHIELDKTIFFVYSHFIDIAAQDIKKPYLQKIKEIVKNLDLHALGYIECSEAVLQYLEKKDEMPLTAILVELDKTNVGVFVYKGGRITHRKIIPRTDNLIDDLLKGFEDLKGKFLLPARIILYNSKDLDDESSKILTYHWSEDYFIQLPRVEVLKEDETIESLIDVFREQLVENGGKVNVDYLKSEHSVDKREVLGFAIGEDIEEKEKIIPSDKPEEIKRGNLMSRFKVPKIPALNKLKLHISRRFTVIFGIAVILVSITLNELLFHKAALTVYVPSESLNKKITINTAIGESDGQLSISVSTISAQFTESVRTTGKRDIGESAKGTVLIHNFDDKEKLFTKGTVLETNGLQFNLDSDVKVASSSLTSDGSAKLPGKSPATVTAIAIGSESNIDKNQRFKIDDLSTSLYFALNTDPFTGGTRKQIQTVAKKDTQDLESKIMERAKNPQLGQSSSQITTKKDGEVIPQLSKIDLKDRKFSNEVGEEATTVTLQATSDTSYFYFDKNYLLSYLYSQLLPEVKQGFSLDKEKIHYSIDVAEKKNNNVHLDLSVNTKILKQASKDEIQRSIIGKNKDALETLLKKQYQIEGFEFSMKNPLPIFNSMLPVIKNNISVVISSL